MESVAYTEVYELFQFLGNNYINKLPKEIWKKIDENKLTEYDQGVIQRRIKNNEMSEEAQKMYLSLKLNYLCTDELEKAMILAQLKHNSKQRRIG